MYYSDRGIPYEFYFKVTNRTEALQYLYQNINFPNQVAIQLVLPIRTINEGFVFKIYGATKLLQAIKGTYSFTLTDSYIQTLSNLHAAEYRQKAGNPNSVASFLLL